MRQSRAFPRTCGLILEEENDFDHCDWLWITSWTQGAHVSDWRCSGMLERVLKDLGALKLTLANSVLALRREASLDCVTRGGITYYYFSLPVTIATPP